MEEKSGQIINNDIWLPVHIYLLFVTSRILTCHKDTETKVQGQIVLWTTQTAGLTCSWIIYKYGLENGRKSGQINDDIWLQFYLLFILQVEFNLP